MAKIGVLLTNTGTPDAPTPRAVRRYLRAFLSDKRIVKIPRLFWLPILYGLILTTRPAKSAKLYQKIWTEEGAPLRNSMHKVKQALNNELNANASPQTAFYVEIGMNYGNPSIKQALAHLYKLGIDYLIILPLFPQYSNTSTGSTFDRTFSALKHWPALSDITMINNYAEDPAYINALASSLASHDYQPERHLLISFHGIPERFVKQGDPYQTQCETTAQRLAHQLGLSHDQWTLCYQSRFGFDKWLVPSLQSVLEDLPKRGKKVVDVICPGFAVDCLETLEEIAIRGRENFIAAGGETLRYIPALNDHPKHIALLAQLIFREI